MNFKDIEIVEAEIVRFQKRIKEWKEAQYVAGNYAVVGTPKPWLKVNGALRRSAADLKNELTLITKGKLFN